ncbi:hypothetical protein SCHPADRAFT_948451 [Schizopora paradoxa]|uniref:Uncharacterized protein n=1 Tax=Schizopora paradoxa TaxID=27342 RepID=A0A0H2QWN7_9AGAM|nr:hypothetical protein SCHPADRAFT_948451 [Schizopora paradoxa]
MSGLANSTTGTDANLRPVLDPRSEVMPDYSLPEFADDRARFTSIDANITEEKAVIILAAVWETEHVNRIKVWDDARASVNPQPVSQTPPENGRVHQPPPTTSAGTGIAPLSTALSNANQGLHPAAATSIPKIVAIKLDKTKPRPRDTLPALANIVYATMSTPGGYICLYYFTAEGRRKADSMRLNIASTFDITSGRTARPAELKLEDCKQDRQLTLDQMREAAGPFCSLVSKYKWGGTDHGEEHDPVATMFFDFFLNVDTHPFRSRCKELQLSRKRTLS